MLVYKITDEYGETRGPTVWGEGVSHEAPGEGELCGAGWIHCYIDPRIAAFMYSVHVPFMNPVLWEAEAEPPFKHDGQLKMGCRKLTTIRKMPMPFIDIEQRVEIAIRCALSTLSTERVTDAFTVWANNWLSGADRSKESTRAVIGASLNTLKMPGGPAEDSSAAALALEAARAAALRAAIAAEIASRAPERTTVWPVAWVGDEAAIAASSAAAWVSTERGEELNLLGIINEVMLQERGEGNGEGM